MLSVSGEGFTYSVMFCIFEHDWGWDIGKRRMTKMKRDLNEIPLKLKEKKQSSTPTFTASQKGFESNRQNDRENVRCWFLFSDKDIAPGVILWVQFCWNIVLDISHTSWGVFYHFLTTCILFWPVWNMYIYISQDVNLLWVLQCKSFHFVRIAVVFSPPDFIRPYVHSITFHSAVLEQWMICLMLCNETKAQ